MFSTLHTHYCTHTLYTPLHTLFFSSITLSPCVCPLVAQFSCADSLPHTQRAAIARQLFKIQQERERDELLKIQQERER